MKASERRLLMLFLVLVALLGGVLLADQLRAWQHRLDRRERDAELVQIEATTLLAEAPQWMARGAWLAQAQPVAKSELEANQGLLDVLQGSASAAGLEIQKPVIDPVHKTDVYRQFGVSFTVKGEVPALMGWIHSTLQPGSFYVVPSLRITPDKEVPEKVTAQVRFWRWYGPELAAAPEPPRPDGN